MDTADELTERLTKENATMSSYMSSNQLVINDEKIKLIVLSKKTRKDETKDISIQAGNHVIKPSAHHKLLGAHFSETMKWKEHILTQDLFMYLFQEDDIQKDNKI